MTEIRKSTPASSNRMRCEATHRGRLSGALGGQRKKKSIHFQFRREYGFKKGFAYIAIRGSSQLYSAKTEKNVLEKGIVTVSALCYTIIQDVTQTFIQAVTQTIIQAVNQTFIQAVIQAIIQTFV